MATRVFLSSLLAAASLVLLSAAHAQQWRKGFMTGLDEVIVEGIWETPDGNYLAAGMILGRAGALLLNPSGDVLWAKKFEKAGRIDSVFGIANLSDGGFTLVGATTPEGPGEPEVLALRISAAGDLVWHHTYGGPLDDRGVSVARAPGDAVVIAANTKSFGAGESDAWVMKIGSDGVPVWQRTFGGPRNDRVAAIEALPDGGFIVVGYTEMGQASEDG